MAEVCDENSCPLIERIEVLELNYGNIEKVHTTWGQKIDRQSTLYTKLSDDVRKTSEDLKEHKIASKDRDSMTHKLLKENNESLAKHMQEESDDRKEIVKTLKSFSDKLQKNEISDKMMALKITGIITVVGGMVAYLAWVGIQIVEMYKILGGGN